jgi:hypothetical protein
MATAADPVNPGESILRRVHRQHFDPLLPLPIHFAAFRPTKDDTAGLAVFRETYLSPAGVAAAGRRPGECAVVRLAVADLARLGLRVVPDELPKGPPGPALITELNVRDYSQDRQRWRDGLLELARLASLAIVHLPESANP